MIRTVMRYLLSLGSFVCLFSCVENRDARTVFDQAESIMSTAPDSALALIRGIDGQSLSTKGLRARHALLLTMARDKNYIDVFEDSTIRVAYDYYLHHGKEKNRLLATYYLGVILQNANESIDAALAFREAEFLAERLEDYRQLSLAEQHLAHIYAQNYDHVRALKYAEKALDAAESAGEQLMAGYCRLDIANQMIREYRYEDAGNVLLSILQSVKSDHPLYSLAARSMAHVLMFQRQPDPLAAKQYYQTINMAKTISLNSHDLGVLALISESENKSKQADRYLEIAESLLRTPADSATFYNDGRNVYNIRKDWEKAHDAKTKSVIIQDRITIQLLGQSISHAMENHYEDNWIIEKERSRSRLFLFIMIGTVLLVASLAIFLYFRKRNQQVLDDMVKIQDISSELMETLIADKIKHLHQLSVLFFSWEDSSVLKSERRQGYLTKDELISSFRTQLSELRKDHSFISSVERSLNLSENGIMEKARQSLGNENELGYAILTLLFSGFSIKSIGYLFRMSEASLRMRKSRFKKQFDLMSEPLRSVFLKKLK